MPIYGIHVCNVVTVMGKKDYMWELPGNSHAVAIQWVRMGADPLLCVCTNIVTIVLPLVEARGLKDCTYNYLTNLTVQYLGDEKSMVTWEWKSVKLGGRDRRVKQGGKRDKWREVML